jgi:predicted ATP-dependent serine protease
LKYYCKNCGFEFSKPEYGWDNYNPDRCNACGEFNTIVIPAHEAVTQWEERNGCEYPAHIVIPNPKVGQHHADIRIETQSGVVDHTPYKDPRNMTFDNEIFTNHNQHHIPEGTRNIGS